MQLKKIEPCFAVIVCTHNPDILRLKRVLSAISKQNGLAECYLIENAGEEIAEQLLREFPKFDRIREPNLGLIHARCCAIENTSSEYLLFVDDDNVLEADALQMAKEFASQNPSVAVFGGKISGEFEVEPAAWKKAALPYLGLRDMGDDQKVFGATETLDFDIPGAGIVVRRDVANVFAKSVKDGRFFNLGRTGEQLSSGDDTAICLLAREMGANLAYVPKISLTHIISEKRIRIFYLFNIIYAIGASAAQLDFIFNNKIRMIGPKKIFLGILLDVWRFGLIGLVMSARRLGYYRGVKKILLKHGNFVM